MKEGTIRNLDNFLNGFNYNSKNSSFRYMEIFYEATFHYQFIEAYIYELLSTARGSNYTIDNYLATMPEKVWVEFFREINRLHSYVSKEECKIFRILYNDRNELAHTGATDFRFYRPFLEDDDRNTDELFEIDYKYLRDKIEYAKSTQKHIRINSNSQIYQLYKSNAQHLLNSMDRANSNLKATIGRILFLSSLCETYFNDISSTLGFNRIQPTDKIEIDSIGEFIHFINEENDDESKEIIHSMFAYFSKDEIHTLRMKRNFYHHYFFIKYLNAVGNKNYFLVNKLMDKAQEDYELLIQITKKVELFLHDYVSAVVSNHGELFPNNSEYFLEHDALYRSFIIEKYFEKNNDQLFYSIKNNREKAVKKGMTEWELFNEYSKEIYEKLEKHKNDRFSKEVPFSLWDICNEKEIWFTDGRFVGDLKKHKKNDDRLEEYFSFIVQNELESVKSNEEKSFLHLMYRIVSKNEMWQGENDTSPKEVEKIKLLWTNFYDYKNEDDLYNKEYFEINRPAEYLRIYATLKMIEIFYYSGFTVVENETTKEMSTLKYVTEININFK